MKNESSKSSWLGVTIPVALALLMHGTAVLAVDNEAESMVPVKEGTLCVGEIDVAVKKIEAARTVFKNAVESKKSSTTTASKRNALDKELENLSAMTMIKSAAVLPAADQMASAVVRDAAEGVKTSANQMARLHALWKMLDEHKLITAEFLEARRQIADCADQVFAAATANAAITNAMAQDKPENAVALTGLAATRKDYVYIAHEQNYDEPQISLFTGPTLSLNGDDKFKTGYEVSALFDGGAGSFFGWGRTFTDFTYQTKGSVNVMAEEDGSVQQPNANQLFREDKGFLRFNTGVSTGLGATNRYSAFVSAGLSTIPGVGGDFPQALRPRVAAGMLARTFISEGFYTRLSLSVAHDEYWKTATGSTAADIRVINSYERGIVEALILIPQLSANGVTLAGRLGLDTPLDGKGPSEVRLSVLASVSFGDFLKKIINLPAAP